jgi:hypothetical protein
MSVKIFCNSCQKFIKDASKNELKTLDGNEICEKCLNFTLAKIEDIKRIARQGIVTVEKARDKALVDLDRSIRKVIQSDKE